MFLRKNPKLAQTEPVTRIEFEYTEPK
jgi:hypothetical protein